MLLAYPLFFNLFNAPLLKGFGKNIFKNFTLFFLKKTIL